MKSLSEEVCQAWEKRNGFAIFTTVSKDGTPNSIYVGSVGMFDNNKIVIADNYFCKTQDNIFNGSTGSILFITEDRKAYQIKGTIEYHKEGEIFDFMKSFNPDRHPGHAAAALVPQEVYSGAEKLS